MTDEFSPTNFPPGEWTRRYLAFADRKRSEAAEFLADAKDLAARGDRDGAEYFLDRARRDAKIAAAARRQAPDAFCAFFFWYGGPR